MLNRCQPIALGVGMTAVALCLHAAMALAGSDPARPNWANDRGPYSSGPEYDASKAICRRVGTPAAAAADQPSKAQRAELAGCSSEPFYYGEGTKIDYVKARLCAFVEAEGSDDRAFGGSTILMQIYANGLGVPRNLELATAYACQIWSAPAESDGRVLHLQALASKPGRFDFCDDVTSGANGSACVDRDSRLAAYTRNAKLDSWKAQLTPAGRTRFGPLQSALDHFVELHGVGEVDQTGSGRAGFVIEEQDAVLDQFLQDIGDLLSGHWSAASSADAQTADARLNGAYRQALAWAGSPDNLSTIRAWDIRKAQRAWLIYRDAFIGFAATAAPGLTRDAVLAHLTTLRSTQLERLPQ